MNESDQSIEVIEVGVGKALGKDYKNQRIRHEKLIEKYHKLAL